MIQLNDFLREVGSIAYERPIYRTGGRGADGTCDCVGLIMGAMYRNGHAKYQLHSSNYFARYETENLEPLTSESQLGPGVVVYKAREDKGQLPERYREGGEHHRGDPLDYYHMGVVTGVDPLEITECTEGGGVNGIDYDRSIKGWTHLGWVKDVSIFWVAPEGENEMTTYKAMVFAAEGTTVNMRKSPNSKGKLMTRVPIGTVVTVNESAMGWSQISVDGEIGYMMSQFLQYLPGEEGGSSDPVSGETDAANQIEKKLDEIIDLLKEMLAGRAREGETIQYTDAE